MNIANSVSQREEERLAMGGASKPGNYLQQCRRRIEAKVSQKITAIVGMQQRPPKQTNCTHTTLNFPPQLVGSATSLNSRPACAPLISQPDMHDVG